jgi:hypothetical protein
MSIADLVRPEEISFGDSPVDNSFTGWLDIYHAMDKYQQENLNAASSENLFFEELSSSRDKIQELTGKPISLGRGESLRTAWKDRYDKIIEQNRLEGKTEWNDVYTTTEAEERARERARQSKIDYDKAVQNAAPGVSVGTAQIAGGMTGWMSDLQNFSATALTAPASGALAAGRSIWAIAGIEAGVNASLEAGMQPAIKDWQNKVGHDYTTEDMVLNIFFAGATGGAFPLFLHGASKTFGGKGLTAEYDRKTELMRKQEALNQKPRELDGAGRAAFDENLKEALTAFHEARAIDPNKLNPKASPRVFADDFVTYEHAVVARNVIDSGVKKTEVDKALRQPYIQEKIKEFEIDSQLARGDIAKIQQELPLVTKELEAARQELKIAKAKMDAASKIVVKDEKDAVIVRAAENEYKKVLDKNARLVKRKSTLETRLSNTSKAMEADENLARLRNNEIPVALEKEYSVYKKNVKKAMDDIRKAEENLVLAADDFMRNAPLDKAQVDAELKIMDTPEYEAGVKKEFERAVMEEMDGKSAKMVILDDDGNPKTVTLTELNDELAADEQMANAIKACQV